MHPCGIFILFLSEWFVTLNGSVQTSRIHYFLYNVDREGTQNQANLYRNKHNVRIKIYIESKVVKSIPISIDQPIEHLK